LRGDGSDYATSEEGSGSVFDDEHDEEARLQPYQREPTLPGGQHRADHEQDEEDFIPDLHFFFERLARIREIYW
jgi:hypothetical protein